MISAAGLAMLSPNVPSRQAGPAAASGADLAAQLAADLPTVAQPAREIG